MQKEKLNSIWSINGEGFYSNKVTETKGKGGSGLETNDKENGFAMGWGLYGLLGPRVEQISTEESNNPALLRVAFYYKGVYYLLSSGNSDSLIATMVKGKMRYEMPPAWFKNYYNVQDSVLITATFNQP